MEQIYKLVRKKWQNKGKHWKLSQCPKTSPKSKRHKLYQKNIYLPTVIVVIMILNIFLNLILSAVAVNIFQPNLPILVDGKENIVTEICVESSDTNDTLDEVVFEFQSKMNQSAFNKIEFFYSGGMSVIPSRTDSWAINDAVNRISGSQKIFRNPNYVKKICSGDYICGEKIIYPHFPLKKGKNYFFLSVSLKKRHIKDISSIFSVKVNKIVVSGDSQKLTGDLTKSIKRQGNPIRQHNDNGVYAYRIPGLITTNLGTLIGIYDVRYTTSLDLQENIDIGMSRSTDGGLNWEKMKIIMDMGEWGGLPEAQNGIGDASILVDENTGDIFVVAVWTHGLGNGRAWGRVGTGIKPEETAQIMLVSSRDDGRTWSKPVNITPMVKDPKWSFTLQGPGRGITMKNGTLVFPMQFIGPDNIPCAAIMYSTDHGNTWKHSKPARSNTTESQVVELEDGVLMLNMRDNRHTGRAVYTTDDMGRTWKKHPTSGTLIEPVCMASIIKVPADKNVYGKDLLIFSNPADRKSRKNMTIKISTDNGMTWKSENSLLLDSECGWGYSCLTMIDRETIGILYESSTAQMLFQAVKLKDILK